MSTQPQRTCPSCGNEFSGTLEFCPVCMLRKGLAGGIESGESSSGDTLQSPPDQPAQRFDHYELVTGEDGKPVELGRGAMGVTYKAFDVDLRCPVTLKVISEKYLGDESARLRFLREARAAARLRHSNVASVLHLGRTGNGYFYAMEFVEGETLENLIKRAGRLEVKLAAGNCHPGCCRTSRSSRTTPSPPRYQANKHHGEVERGRNCKGQNYRPRPGEDAGRIGFRSGDFIAWGLCRDPRIRQSGAVRGNSGRHPLGPLLARRDALADADWQHTVSRYPGEVMSQHQRTPLPLTLLESAPQPVVVLLEVLLEKDPSRRFQTPAELLKAIPMITGALDAGRKITHQSLQKTPPTASRVGTRKPPVKLAPKKISVARLPVTGTDLFGREEDIAFLDDAWANREVNVVTIVAWAGVGKSTLVNHWLQRMATDHYRSAELIFGWSFYRQGTSGDISSADEFLDAALSWFGDPDPRLGTAWEKGERLAKLVAHRRTLLVLDGLEPL
jgi:hypothetical protein